MKMMKLWMLAAILFCGIACVTSCNGDGNANSNANVEKEVKDSVKNAADPIFLAVDKYLVDSIGTSYTPGEMCIPVVSMTCSDGMRNDSLSLWGDFWVFNYNVVGDTLKCVSGGSHPGKMLLLKNDKGEFQVVSFEQVEDGSGNLESAKRIFGEYYDAFHAVNSDENYREKARATTIADYVKAHKLPVKYYQDFGWPAKEIPAE